MNILRITRFSVYSLFCITFCNFNFWILTILSYDKTGKKLIQRSYFWFTDGSDHYFHTWWLYVRPHFHNVKREHKYYKTGVIYDPLGQTHSLASCQHCFHFEIFWKVGTDADGRTDQTHVKIMITSGQDCGSAEWIKFNSCFFIRVGFIAKLAARWLATSDKQ